MLKGLDVPGPTQLATYMRHMNRMVGWLVYFDTRKPNRKTKVPPSFKRAARTIRTVVIDINPIPPHQLK